MRDYEIFWAVWWAFVTAAIIAMAAFAEGAAWYHHG